MLAHSEKAADPKDDVFNLAGLVENEFFDIAYFFVGFVINVDANELGGAPSPSLCIVALLLALSVVAVV